MKGVSLWKGNVKGTSFLVHKYIGPYKTDAKDPTVSIPEDTNYTNELSIQDIIVLENRNRKYDDAIVDLIGCYQLQDPGIDLSQFGAILNNDTVYVEFHMNDQVEKLGRRLMAGDVLEAVHLRDHLPLNQNADPIPKYYVIQECTRPSSGYGTTWFPHIWRAKCNPIADTEEFRDILHNPDKKTDTSMSWQDAFGIQNGTGEGVDDLSGIDPNEGAGAVSTLNKEVQLSKEISRAAAERVKERGFFIRHFYMRPANMKVKDGLINWVMDDDNVPPNWTGDFIPCGKAFPQSPETGDYFIRTDYEPETLFLQQDGVWRIVQQDWRTEWVPAGRILESYLHNNKIVVIGSGSDDTIQEKQALSDIILPRADYLPGKRKD